MILKLHAADKGVNSSRVFISDRAVEPSNSYFYTSTVVADSSSLYHEVCVCAILGCDL